jgi:hypothetical protein
MVADNPVLAVRRRLLPLCALPLACGVARAQVVAPPEPPPPAPRPSAARPPATSPRVTGQAPPLPPPEPPAGPPAEVLDAVPLSVEAVGRGGRWLVACTARADSDGNGRLEVKVGVGGALGGDALRPELFIGGRPAEAIDDLLGYDPTGRYVAIRRGKQVELVDVSASERVDLGKLGFDDRDDTLPYRQHRALAFDPRGELFAYARTTPKRELVLRNLENGEERSVADLPGEPWRFAWDGTGDQLVVSAIVEDSTKNGRLDWPARLAKRPRLLCQGPIPRFGVSAENGDRPSTYLVARDAERAEPAPEFAASFGRSWVARALDGALFVHRGKARRPVASAECGARILHADPARELFLVACTNAKNPAKAPVELLTPGSRQELGIAIQPALIDRWPEAPQRLLPLYPGSDALLVDLERRVTHPLTPGDRVMATSGARALARRGKRFVLFDADTRTETPLPGEVEKLAGLAVEGSFVAVGTLVFDLERATLLGRVKGRPLALTLAGEALVAEGGAAAAERLARGPLRWQAPARAAVP